MTNSTLHITSGSTEWFDFKLLLEAATNTYTTRAYKKPRIEGILPFLLAGGSIEGLTRRELYLIYLKYEEQLTHAAIGELFGNSMWASNYDFRQIVPKLKALLK
jgi:hypothetical protein